MSPKRDLNQELFGGSDRSLNLQQISETIKEISLSELADLSELAEEQAKVRVKVTHLSTSVAALTDSVEHTDHRLDKLREALKGTVSQVEQLSAADDLHSQQTRHPQRQPTDNRKPARSATQRSSVFTQQRRPAAAKHRATKAKSHHADAHSAVRHLAVRRSRVCLRCRQSLQLPQAPEPG